MHIFPFLVILAKVISPPRILEYQRHLFNFRVEAKRVFRQKKQVFVKGSTKMVFTPRSSDLCHARAGRNGLYLFGGNVKRNRIFITSCGLIKRWKTLPHLVRKAVRQGKISCDCTVVGCNGQSCVAQKGRPDSHSCETFSRKTKNCYAQYGVCTKKGKNCRWSKRSVKLVTACLRSS